MANSIALLGGSFNPPHIGHLLVAQDAYQRLGVSKVIFIPASQNPLKTTEISFATSQQRLEMVRLATGSDTRFDVDPNEVLSGGMSYTITTLQRYCKNYSNKLFFLVGADAAMDLGHWKNIEKYADLCTLVIYNRPGNPDFSNGLPEELCKLGINWEFLKVPQVEVSSSEIRRRISAGEPFDYMVHETVANYIRIQGLYK